jgi:hypothetical protein
MRQQSVQQSKSERVDLYSLHDVKIDLQEEQIVYSARITTVSQQV